MRFIEFCGIGHGIIFHLCWHEALGSSFNVVTPVCAECGQFIQRFDSSSSEQTYSCCFLGFFFGDASSIPLLLLLVEFCCWNMCGGWTVGYMSSTALNVNSVPRILLRFSNSLFSSISCWSQFGLDVALTVVDYRNWNYLLILVGVDDAMFHLRLPMSLDENGAMERVRDLCRLLYPFAWEPVPDFWPPFW